MILSEIQFRRPNVGYVPKLEGYIKHGFSWGVGSPNMSFQHGSESEVLTAEVSFLNNAGFSRRRGLVIMVPEHGTRIVEVDDSVSLEMRTNVTCDCLITTTPHLTLAVKPADCIVVMITGAGVSGRVLAMLHVGRKGLDNLVVRSVIQKLVEKYALNVSELIVGMSPCITVRNYFIQKKEELSNLGEWDGFIVERNGLFFLDFVGLIRRQFEMVGVRKRNIIQYDVDTFDAAKVGHSFSHRHSQMNSEVRNGRFIVAAEIVS